MNPYEELEEIEKEIARLLERKTKLEKTVSKAPLSTTIEGEKLGAEEAERVGKKADRLSPGWTDRAFDVVYAVAQTNQFFHIDDVHEKAAITGLDAPHDARAWGPPMIKAQRQGVCQKTGETKKSRYPGCHAHLRPVYQSLVYEDEWADWGKEWE